MMINRFLSEFGYKHLFPCAELPACLRSIEGVFLCYFPSSVPTSTNDHFTIALDMQCPTQPPPTAPRSWGLHCVVGSCTAPPPLFYKFLVKVREDHLLPSKIPSPYIHRFDGWSGLLCTTTGTTSFLGSIIIIIILVPRTVLFVGEDGIYLGGARVVTRNGHYNLYVRHLSPLIIIFIIHVNVVLFRPSSRGWFW